MKFSHETVGTCSRRIDIEVEDGVLVNASFVGGCSGNSQVLTALVKGMPVTEVVRRLKGIPCQEDTSCPDQLARALEASAQMK